MYVRWDGHITPNTSSNRLTTNTDITATIAEAAGLSWPMEGRSWLSTRRAGTVLEQVQYNGPAYCGYRTRRYLFVEYNAGEGRELYDYRSDPNERANSIRDPAYRTVRKELRNSAKASCSPTPPGFTWAN